MKRTMLAVAAVLAAGVAGAVQRPNLVFVLADDLGWTDLACQGSTYYETPAIDRLAAQGMRFTHGYTCGPNCQPTRAALMSGQYGPRTGVYTVGGTDRFDTSMRPLVPVENITRLAPAVVTVAETLKKAGYATAMFGKWHLGEDPEHHPSAQGFDEAIVTMGRHYKFSTTPKVEVPDDVYLADFLTDRAVDFIERRKDAPFFLYVPHFGVHSPHDAKPEKEAAFKDKPAAGGHHSPVYAGMIASVDESVGRIVATLDRLGLSSNTLVIFSSDNGGVGGYAREGLKEGAITDNAPLRSGKGSLYEGGTRVPYIFRWPGTIAAGGTCAEPIASIDIHPTFAALAGGKPPPGQVLDGADITPLLRGDAASFRRDALYWHFPGYLGAGANLWRTTPVSAIRRGEWKLLEFLEDGHLELYNLVTDVGQTNNLAAAKADLAKELHAKLQSWRAEVKAPMPAKRESIAPAPAAGGKGKGGGKGGGKKKQK